MDNKLGISIIFLSFFMAAVGLSQQFGGTETTETPAIVAPVSIDQGEDPIPEQQEPVEQQHIEEKQVTEEQVKELPLAKAEDPLDESVSDDSSSESDQKPLTLNVEWLPTPEDFDLLKLPSKPSFKQILWSKKTGVVKSGNYSGWSVISAAFVPDLTGELGIYSPEMHRLLISPDLSKVIQISKQSHGVDDHEWFTGLMTDMTLDGFDQPKLLRIHNHPLRLNKTYYTTVEQFFDHRFPENPIPRAVLENGETLYQHPKSNCFFVVARDGTLHEYKYDFAPIANAVSNNSSDHFRADGSHRMGALQLNFEDSSGAANQNYYRSDYRREHSYPTTGCMIVDDLSDDELTPLGKSGEIAQFYVLKDPEHAVLKKDYELRFRGTYHNTEKTYSDPHTEYPEFVEKNSVVYWKDPFGQWIRFIHARYIGDIDCCHGVGGYFQRKWD